MKIKSLFIFPPGWTPFGPYLALPHLKGFLEERNINVLIEDLNVEFFDYLFQKDFLNKAYEKCVREFEDLEKLQDLPKNKQERYFILSKVVLSKYVVINIENAKKLIRDKNTNLEEREYAKNILTQALFIINNSSEGLDIKFNKLKLKYSEHSTFQVLNSLEDKEANIFFDFYKKTIEKINELNIDFIAISITGSSQLISAITLAKLIKENCSKVRHITFGGNFITRIAKLWTNKHPFFDFIDSIILYEGEDALYQLIKGLEEDNLDLSSINNLCYLEKNELIFNEIISVKIETTPIPNFDGFSLNKYFSSELILPLFSSRSCYSKCAFCTIPMATYGNYRIMPEERVIDTMIYLKIKYNTNLFTFVDETFSIERMKKLSILIKNSKEKFYWYSETRFDKLIDKETAELLYNNGCRKIQFGLESYNQNVLDKMKKNIDISLIEPSLINCIHSGIAVHLFFMIGFPTETKEEAIKTLNFSRRILNIAKEKYSNYETSRGFSTFGLEKNSYVYENPNEFGIKILENSLENDLYLQHDYETTHGLSIKEAEEILNNNTNDNILNTFKDKVKLYQSLLISFNSEEENFIRMVKKTNKHYYRKSESIYKKANETYDFPEYVNYRKFKFNPFNYNISNEYVFFNVIKNYVYMLSEIEFENINYNKFLNELSYYGFLENEKTKYTLDDLKSKKIKYNEKVIELDCSNDERKFLIDFVTGNIIQVNELSYNLLKLFDGQKTYNKIETMLYNETIISNKNDFLSLIEHSIKNNILLY